MKKNVLLLFNINNYRTYGRCGNGYTRAAINRICQKLKRIEYDEVYIIIDKIKCGQWQGDIADDLQHTIMSMESKEIPIHNITKDSVWCEVLTDNCLNDTVGHIEMMGYCTDTDIITNALIIQAKFPKVTIRVDPACCAGTSRENHKAAIRVMESCLIDTEYERSNT